jgi:metallophosphoesterase (TIGR00282 family)
MSLRIVFLGDIVGGPGCKAVTQQVPVIRERWSPDLIIANAETAASGTGLTPEIYKKLCARGIDAITLGDHVYKKKQIVPTLESETNIIRPANLSGGAAGKRWMCVKPKDKDGKPVGGPGVYVMTVLGRIYMNMPANDPFATVDDLLSDIPERDPIVIVEVHAEATSEKIAMGWHLNGRVTAVVGTHTHTPTADYRILPEQVDGMGSPHSGAGGTAYITDLGMTGPHDSVLGRRADRVVAHMTTNMPHPFDVAEGNPRVQGVVIDIDTASRRATAIDRIDLPADTGKPPFAG